MRAAVSDVNFIGVRLRSYKQRELAIVNRELAMLMFNHSYAPRLHLKCLLPLPETLSSLRQLGSYLL